VNRRVALLTAVGAAVVLGTTPTGTTGQQGASTNPESRPRPELRAAPVRDIHIDGRLDEAAWASVPPVTEFIQSEPDEGLPATQRTEVRVAFDGTRLYIGAEMFDTDPAGIVPGGLERDSPGILFEEMDALGVTLDTYLDRRSSFIFFVNPAGGIKDGQGTDDGRYRDYGWDGVVDVKTTMHERGWTVEMAIPWRTLRFDPTLPDQRWGMNLMRRIRRRNEVSYWAPLDRRNRVFLMSRAGVLTGMGKLPAGLNMSVKPFTLASHAGGASLAADAKGDDADGGVDLKWGLTPNLTLDLTWRTDFSQVEVDQQQVNLTRFPVFFPELRTFFLENSGTFTFGDVDGGPGGPRLNSSIRDLTLFHSRQIGLRSGHPVPLLGGARLTGQVGGFELGLLNVQGEQEGTVPQENFTVLRVRRRVLTNSDVGFIVTNRDPSGPATPASQAAGVDANLTLGGKLFINTYVAGTREGEESDHAARLSVGWRDALWNTSLGLRRVGERFDPGLGFVRRRALRESYATVGLHTQPHIPRVLEVSPFVEITNTTDLSGRLESRETQGGLSVDFHDRSTLNFGWTRTFERLATPFNVRAGVSIPVGDYTFSQGSVRYQSSQGHALSGNLNVSSGGFWDGTRTTVTGGLRWQPDRHLVLDLDATHNAVTAQGTSFTADLYGARLQYAWSTTLNLSAFVQVNADTDEMVTNLRMNFIHAPLSDLFLLLTERRSLAGSKPVLERFFTVKVTRLLLF
jgi:hypothetical protein